jgi:hypothetical protein
MAVKSAKQVEQALMAGVNSNSGKATSSEGGEDDAQENSNEESGHKYHEVCRDNISLRLRLLAGNLPISIARETPPPPSFFSSRHLSFSSFIYTYLLYMSSLVHHTLNDIILSPHDKNSTLIKHIMCLHMIKNKAKRIL